jgi:hypothetical protein
MADADTDDRIPQMIERPEGMLDRENAKAPWKTSKEMVSETFA